jgi:hypothetical protein
LSFAISVAIIGLFLSEFIKNLCHYTYSWCVTDWIANKQLTVKEKLLGFGKHIVLGYGSVFYATIFTIFLPAVCILRDLAIAFLLVAPLVLRAMAFCGALFCQAVAEAYDW